MKELKKINLRHLSAVALAKEEGFGLQVRFLKIIYFFLFLSLATSFAKLQAGPTDGLSSVSLESHVTFTSSDTDNIIQPFAWMKNGFTLEDASTTCTFKSVFPISGNIYFNGGSLYLDSDLVFNNQATVHSFGPMYANSHLVELSETTTFLATGSVGTIVFDNAKICVYPNLNYLEIHGPVRFQGNCVFNANESVITLGSTAAITIADGATVTFQNATLDGVSTGKIIFESNTSKMIFDEVVWKQDANFSFTQGSFEVKNNFIMNGAYTFAYQSSQTSTIKSASILTLDKNITFSYDPGIVNKNLIEMEDAASFLVLKNATLHTTVTGMQLKKGNLLIKKNATLVSEKQYLDNDTILDGGFCLGNDSSDDDIYCEIGGVETLNLSSGSLEYRNVNSSSWHMMGRNSDIRISEQSALKLYQSLTLDNGYACFCCGSQLLKASGKELTGQINVVGSFVQGTL